MNTVSVFVGQYGTYIIPDKIKELVRFTKSGWPDKRCSNYNKFLEWVEKQEAKNASR